MVCISKSAEKQEVTDYAGFHFWRALSVDMLSTDDAGEMLPIM